MIQKKRGERYQNVIQAAFVKRCKLNKSCKKGTRRRLQLQIKIVKKRAIIDKPIMKIRSIKKNIRATYENIKSQLRDLYKNAKQQEYKEGLALLDDFDVMNWKTYCANV